MIVCIYMYVCKYADARNYGKKSCCIAQLTNLSLFIISYLKSSIILDSGFTCTWWRTLKLYGDEISKFSTSLVLLSENTLIIAEVILPMMLFLVSCINKERNNFSPVITMCFIINVGTGKFIHYLSFCHTTSISVKLFVFAEELSRLLLKIIFCPLLSSFVLFTG